MTFPGRRWHNAAVSYARSLAFVLLAGVAGVLLPAPARGQPAASATPHAAKRVVVVADVTDDLTANAKLRAAVFETVEKRGYSPAVKVDVAGAAQDAGALDAGRISTAPAALGTVRDKLGVALLVRVSSDWVRGDQTGVRITLVGEQGTKSQVVAAPSADPRPAVAKAVGAMLDELTGAKAGPAAGLAPKPTPASSAAPAPGPQPGASSAGQAGEAPGGPGVILPAKPAPGADEAPPLTPTQAWDQRGGVVASYEARGMATGVMIPDQAYSSVNPVSKQTETGHATTWGIGGGIGVRIAMMYLPLPDPATSSGGFAAFSLGTGVDGSVLYVRPPSGYSYDIANNKVVGRGLKRQDRAWLYGNIPLQLGVRFGIGHYRTQKIWRGVVLGFVYSPTWTYRLDIQSLDGEGKFNFAGFETDLDITSLEARRGIVSESQIRLFAYVLPRIKSDLPWLASAGIGAVWY